MNVIECQAVGRTFRTHRRAAGWLGLARSFLHRETTDAVALQDIDLRIERGELVGLIGENGAGKTTLVKVLTGIIPASSGRAALFGRDSFQLGDPEKQRISLVMGQRSQLWWDVPPLDSFHLLREIYQVPTDRFDHNLRYFAEHLSVADRLDIQLRNLSLGERMKMELIGALLHDPEVLFLDEPTIGLDLVSRATIREFLVAVNRDRAVTILLTSHDMEDIERTCQRILILDHGRLIHDGDRAELQRRIESLRSVEVHLEPGPDPWTQRHADAIGGFGARLERAQPGQLTLLVDANRVRELTRYLLAELPIRDLAIERQPLEQLIRAIFAGTQRASPDPATDA